MDIKFLLLHITGEGRGKLTKMISLYWWKELLKYTADCSDLRSQ